jgi:hypothetical protein
MREAVPTEARKQQKATLCRRGETLSVFRKARKKHRL